MTSLFPPTRRIVIPAVLILLSAAVAAWVVFGRVGDEAGGLGTRTASAGDIEVTMTATALGPARAEFEIEFETHTGSLDLDPAAAATLRVAGSAVATTPAWDGPGPGGHHRAGTLRFEVPIRSGDTVELHLTGLPTEVTGVWTAP
ncbi:hypothetical protein [Nocardia sp. IFM 10818]